MNVKCSFLYDRYSKPIVNFSLRGLTMGCRFLLIIFLAKLFSPSEVGLFGLISATVVISQLLIGGEYYSYSQRELISMGKDRWSFVLQHQAVALLLLYMFFAPMLVGLFHWDVLPGYLMSFFYLILILESIAQELNRVMIAMQCQITASWILFCRHGLWVLCILPYIWVYPESRSLDLILGAWVIGCTIALLLALFMIKREVNPWKIWALDLGWVKRGFKVSLLYFAGALCFRAIFTIDRYAVESLLGLDFLGVYVVYIGLAMSIVTVLDPLIFSFAYPKLIRLITEKNHHGFKLAMVELAKSTLKTTLVAILLVSYLAPFIFVWIDKPFYT
jgi:O-antigen/teichoic acid export membrane protein